MAIVRHAEAEALARRARVLDLADVRAQAGKILDDARAEARRIVDVAREERERLVRDAAREARAAGREEGLEEGRAEGREEGARRAMEEMAPRLEGVERALGGVIDGFIDARRALLDEAREEVVRIALAIASRLVARALEGDPSLVVDQVERVLAQVASSGRVSLRVHPDDEPLVREALPRIAEKIDSDVGVELAGDPGVERGGCVVRTRRGGEIDAGLATQIDRIARALLSGRGSPAPRSALRLDEEAA